MSIENIPVRFIKGVGEKTADKLSRLLNIKSVRDLLYYFPRDWEDRANPVKISGLIPGQKTAVRGKVETVSSEWMGKYLIAFKARIKDPTGILNAVWIRRRTRSYDVLGTLKKEITAGSDIFVTGAVSTDFWDKTISVQEYEVVTADPKDLLNANRIVPVYPLTEHFTNKFLRGIIKHALDKYADNLEDLLPEIHLNKYGLCGIKSAVMNIHFPETFAARDASRKRLAYDEFLNLELKLEFIKNKRRKEKKEFNYKISKTLLTPFRNSLPFRFTEDQTHVINEIIEEMESPKPMNRLLQGDVGSGKTVVALSAMLLAVESGFQAAMLAPTEILAEQHLNTIKSLIGNLPVKMSYVVGKMSKKDKTESRKDISSGTANIILGTHALLEEDIKFANLSLIVIDEQHKFGVEQRLKLRKKTQFRHADILLMSATPIPRTLGLTLYGDLDISTIKQLPPGRITVKTLEMTDVDAYDFIREKVSQGEQAFIVYPLVLESEKLQLKSAIKEADNLRKTEFKDFAVGLVYGKMKPEEKDRVMNDFEQKKYAILISTTVIESGIDIPNATVMVIEHAERYGLSTLHQLRGRVGRGGKQSFCILLSNAKTEDSQKRLRTLLQTTDGFKIAEEDLMLRGYGEFFGTQQSGLSELKIGNMATDFEIIQYARETAVDLLKKKPETAEALLSSFRNQFLKKEIEFADA